MYVRLLFEMPQQLQHLCIPLAMSQLFLNKVLTFRALGLLPSDLVCDLAIQFCVNEEEAVKTDPSLTVPLQDLREALWWYCTNNWEWVLATRNDLPTHALALGSHFETLLSAYTASLPSTGVGVPSELLDIATPIQPESEVLLPSEDCSAVILDNGIEDETPVALWNAAISKYNLLQQAEENLAKLAMSDEKSEKQELEEKNSWR